MLGICNEYIYQNITSYTLNLHNAISQLYLSKAGGKKESCLVKWILGYKIT